MPPGRAAAHHQAPAVERRRPLVDGVRYAVTLAGEGTPLLLLHGFTGSAATWEPHLGALAPHVRVVAVDLLGHGETEAPPDAERYRVQRAVADLLALLDLLAGPRVPAHVLGYSMGGRLALHLALAAPGRVRTLTLESASPGILDPAERAARVQSDQQLAELIEREGLAAFVRHWESLPLFASQRALPIEVQQRQRAQRLRGQPAGLANSLRGMGAGAQEPVHDLLPTLAMPVLLLAGREDARYAELAGSMAGRIPHARLALIPGAGHAPHLEQPAAFERQVLRFLLQDRSSQ